MKVVLEPALVLLRILKEVLDLVRDIRDLRRPKSQKISGDLLLTSEAAVLLATLYISIIRLEAAVRQQIANRTREQLVTAPPGHSAF